MKSIILILATAAVLATSAAARAQEAQALISARDGTVTSVVTTPALTLHDAFGAKGFDIDAKAFAGLAWDNGKLSGGLILSHRVPIAREVFGDIGLYSRWRAGNVADAGLFVGLGWKL